MLCGECHRQLERGASHCGACGRPLGDASAPLELVVDGRRVALLDELTIGRAPACSLVLSEPSVSRRHARISAGGMLADDGSHYGTWLDGRRVDRPVALRPGSLIALGDVDIRVERRRDDRDDGETIVVRPGASLVLDGAPAEDVGAGIERPCLRSGIALKRLDASEGPLRWVLRDLEDERFLRLGDEDAWLLQRLDGSRSLQVLATEADRRFGAMGAARLARLVAALGQRGLLAGVEGAATLDAGRSGLSRLLVPHVKLLPRAGPAIDALYGAGGWLMFTRPARLLIGAVAVAGVAVFAVLVAAVYGEPFVVANKIGLGGLVFLLGRLLLAVVHELAHGLTLASYGRRIPRAGLKLILIFPFTFVDTSEAWFERRGRRIAVSAAGPASDLALGGLFALACLLSPEGTIRDILFNLAFAAYVGALFNLNPLIERDGYHVLVDLLREPQLRRRAREQLARRLAGRRTAEPSRTLTLYGLAGLAWTLVAGLFAVGLTLRYEAMAVERLGAAPAHALLVLLWLSFLAPAAVMVGGPLLDRLRARRSATAARAEG